MIAKQAILERAQQRTKKIQISQMDLKSDANHSLTPFLTPLESWEMVAKLSRELYFLHTGLQPSNHVDKTIIQIHQRER